MGSFDRLNSVPSGSGTGTIGGTLGATDNAIIRADGTGGLTAQTSKSYIGDDGSLFVSGNNTSADFAVSTAFHVINLRSDAYLNFDSGTDGKDFNLQTYLRQPSAGVLSINAGAGKLLSSVLTEDNTAGSGSPNIILAAESGTRFFNTGASAQNYHTLPTAVAGMRFIFTVTDSDGIRVTAPGAATIRIGGIVTAAGGHIDSTTVGDSVTLVAYSTTQWIATSVVGGGAVFSPGWTAT